MSLIITSHELYNHFAGGTSDIDKRLLKTLILHTFFIVLELELKNEKKKKGRRKKFFISKNSADVIVST